MRVIAVMNLKGGASKTTTTVHAAVEAMRRGLRVLIIDTDHPQNSAAMWASARGGEAPTVVVAHAHRLKTTIEQARTDGYQLVLIDTAPRLGPDAVDIANLSDRVIVPVKPDPFDLAAVQETIEIVKQAKVDTLLFLACCPPKGVEVEETRELLIASCLPVAKASIGHRRAFTRAVLSGKAAIEFEPKGKAAMEMRNLIDEVLA